MIRPSGFFSETCSMRADRPKSEPPRVVRVLFVRHAQSANKGAAEASRDPGLTKLGEMQAQALGERLSAELKDTSVHILSSPMRRCILTIQPLIKARSIVKNDREYSQALYLHGGLYEYRATGEGFSGSSAESLVEEFGASCIAIDEAGWACAQTGAYTHGVYKHGYTHLCIGRYIYEHGYAHLCIGRYIYKHGYAHLCKVAINVCTHVCIHVRIHVCIHVCICVCTHACIRVCIFVRTSV